MSLENENQHLEIPEEVLRNIRNQDPKVLRKIARQFSQKAGVRQERDASPGEIKPEEETVKLLKSLSRDGQIEIRSWGGTEAVTKALFRTKTAVSLVCPDFETRKTDKGLVYVAGGKIGSGIGSTGNKLAVSLPFIDKLASLTGELDFYTIYQASAEEIITDEDILNIKQSARAMEEKITESPHVFTSHFMVMDQKGLTDEARELAGTIILTRDEVLALTRDREDIIRMRTGTGGFEPLTFESLAREAAFDIATHILSEQKVQQMIGKLSFVHLSVDSARFSEYYNNPAIAIGRQIHYKGD